MELTKTKLLHSKQLDRLLWRLPPEIQNLILAWHYAKTPYALIRYCPFYDHTTETFKKHDPSCGMCLLLQGNTRFYEHYERFCHHSNKIY